MIINYNLQKPFSSFKINVMIQNKKKLNRRKFIQDVSITSSGLIISKWIPSNSFLLPTVLKAAPVPSMAIKHGSSPEKITRAAVNALGGMSKFVSKGDVVAIKPNVGWDRKPEQAANTNPLVVSSLVQQCFEAGAKEVRVIDNTCNEPHRCYKRSGIADAVKQKGGTIRLFDERKNRVMRIGGIKIKKWLVNRDIYEVDCLINVPIAKQHSLAKLTMGMKNWFGVIGGNRGKLHQSIDQAIADLASFFKPKLIILDAFRVLIRNGPQGGNIKDVKYPHIVAAGVDQVAIDAFGSTLFGLNPEDIGYIKIAEKMGIGKSKFKTLLK